MKRLKLTHGTARVENDAPDALIMALDAVSKKAYSMDLGSGESQSVEWKLCDCKEPKIIEQNGINYCVICKNEAELFRKPITK